MPGGSKPKRAGAAYEAAVRDYLQAHGFPQCERPALWGRRDRGDLLGVDGFVVQVRNTNRIDLAGAVDDAKVQAGNNGSGWPVAIVKRKGRGVGGSYVVMELETWAEMVR
jgi:hypothetical protein